MSKGIEHASVDRGERKNKPFAWELVHASIKLEMSCTVNGYHMPHLDSSPCLSSCPHPVCVRPFHLLPIDL